MAAPPRAALALRSSRAGPRRRRPTPDRGPDGDRPLVIADRFDAQHERGNSHMRVLATYQRMLSVWKPLWEKKVQATGGPDNYRFSVEELREILDSWPYRAA